MSKRVKNQNNVMKWENEDEIQLHTNEFSELMTKLERVTGRKHTGQNTLNNHALFLNDVPERNTHIVLLSDKKVLHIKQLTLLTFSMEPLKTTVEWIQNYAEQKGFDGISYYCSFNDNTLESMLIETECEINAEVLKKYGFQPGNRSNQPRCIELEYDIRNKLSMKVLH